MGKLILSSLLFISVSASAVTPTQFCQFLQDRASVNPKSLLKSKGTRQQLDELMEIMGKTNDFLGLATAGIDKKMSWETFKKFAAKKGVDVSNYFQPQYDGMYLRKYCGTLHTEASVKVSNGVTKESAFDEHFELSPNPSEHEYSRQIKSLK